MAERAHGHPRFTGMPFVALPGLQVIAESYDIKASLFTGYAELKKSWGRKLFEGQLKSNQTFAQRTHNRVF